MLAKIAILLFCAFIGFMFGGGIGMIVGVIIGAFLCAK